jgi:RHS repeat-associated protein
LIASENDYYPFGMVMPGRNFSSDQYRFGFNGVEKVNEVSGLGNHYEFKYREYDPRIGKFWSVDPLFKDYPWNSTYAFAENRVVDGKDLEGLEYSNASNKSGTYGPLTDKRASETGATLEPGFKSESEINSDNEQKHKSEVLPHASDFQSQHNIKAQNPGTIKPPDLSPDQQMAKQFGQGFLDGTANELLGLGITKLIKPFFNGSTELFRAVSQAELDDIAVNGLRVMPGGYETGKLFATSAEDAAKFGAQNFKYDGIANTVIKVKVANSVMKDAFKFTADGMKAVSLPTDALKQVKVMPLDYSPLQFFK